MPVEQRRVAFVLQQVLERPHARLASGRLLDHRPLRDGFDLWRRRPFVVDQARDDRAAVGQPVKRRAGERQIEDDLSDAARLPVDAGGPQLHAARHAQRERDPLRVGRPRDVPNARALRQSGDLRLRPIGHRDERQLLEVARARLIVRLRIEADPRACKRDHRACNGDSRRCERRAPPSKAQSLPRELRARACSAHCAAREPTGGTD